MKKTYIAPGMEIVNVQTAAGMLAGSFELNSETVSRDKVLSRRGGSLWDDDED